MSVLARYKGLSDPIKTERRAELVVLCLLLLLVLQIAWGVYSATFPSIPDPVRPTPDSLVVSEISGLSSASAEQRAQIQERPLFWASRAPLIAKEVEPEPKPASKGAAKSGKIENVKLSGVFGADDAGGVIIISKGKKRRLMVGEELDGWTLKSVDPVSASFASGDQLASLALSVGKISPSTKEASESSGGARAGGQNKLKPGTGSGAKQQENRKTKDKEPRDSLRLGGGDSGR